MRPPAPDAVDDLVEDLDDDDARSDVPGSRPSSGSSGVRRLLRSPWALPAAVTALVLVAGGAGLRQAHAAAVDDLTRERRLSAVQLGSATTVMTVDPEDGQPVAGSTRQRLEVAVLNSGDQPVSVSVVGTSLEHADLRPGASAVPLRPGSGGTLALDLDVDCAALPFEPMASTPPAPVAEWLDLAVDVGGTTTRRHYLLPDSGWGGLQQQLVYPCHPDAWGTGVSAAPVLDADGTLRLGLTNEARDDVRLVLQAPASLGVSADPPLPLDLRASETTEVRLSLAPDCARLPGGIGDPYALPVELLAQTDGSGGSVLDQTTTAVWVARQLALTCG